MDKFKKRGIVLETRLIGGLHLHRYSCYYIPFDIIICALTLHDMFFLNAKSCSKFPYFIGVTLDDAIGTQKLVTLEIMPI